MYGAWRSREHFSVERSAPWFVSDSLDKVEEAVRSQVTHYRPNAVIAGDDDGTWSLLYFVELQRLRRSTPEQAVKYEGVRAGRVPWSSTMRPPPETTETTAPSIDLDRLGR